jgi:hypothetical protein
VRSKPSQRKGDVGRGLMGVEHMISEEGGTAVLLSETVRAHYDNILRFKFETVSFAISFHVCTVKILMGKIEN